ncbi:DUF5994 family protein [Actinocatenispora rupis]|uniref:Uncharacterized protein n=1 Tax=Actinocatenispora rupis TaxID=519421 RepID=A0A8J3NA72_9ACTN|nr:DUF5994 family protein [Actinocatenispora rupis]GID12064.1 hypothetical protein Aru02nite_29530 [Actinocatenispora rupis]
MAHGRSADDGVSRFSWFDDDGSGPAVDGAWWPRCPDPARELPTLAQAIARRGYEPVVQVQANVDDWAQHPDTVALGGRPVPVTWFTLLFERRVLVTCMTGRRVSLTLVPFDAPESRAAAALRWDQEPDHQPERRVLRRLWPPAVRRR